MIQPLNLTNRHKFSQAHNDDAQPIDDGQSSDFNDSWLETSVPSNTFDRQVLRSSFAKQRTTDSQLMLEWRALTRGTLTRLNNCTVGDITLSSFCLLLSVWILVIWQSEAPFWWVPGLSIFFGIAAVAALHDAIWYTPQSRKAQLRRQLRQSKTQLQRLSNRLTLMEAATNRN